MGIRRYASPLFCLSTIFSLVLPLLSPQTQPSADPAFQEQMRQGPDALSSAKYPDAISAFKKANKRQNNSCADCYLGIAIASLRLDNAQEVLENSDKGLHFAADNTQRVFPQSEGERSDDCKA